MKSNKIRLLRALSLAICFTISSFYSEAQISSNQVEGSWTIDFDATILLLSSQKKQEFDALSPSQQAQIESQMVTQTFQFDHEGTFNATSNGGLQSGNWEISGNELTISFPNGASVTHIVQAADSLALVLKVVHDPNSHALFHDLSLVRSTN